MSEDSWLQDCGNALQEGDVKFLSKHSFIAFILFYLRIHTEGLDSTFCITIFVFVEMIQHNKIVILLYTNISCFIKLIYA